MDKLFGLLKTKIEEVKHEAVIAQQKSTNRSQVPVLVRFAMNRISISKIQSSFHDTGLCPLDSSAISGSLLSDRQDVAESHINHAEDHTNHTVTRFEDAMQTDGLSLQVFDDAGQSLDPESIAEKVGSKETQTDPIESLPCSICITNDVRVHPAVTSGAVDLELASVLIPDKATVSTSQSGQPKRDNSKRKGRWLTHETEVQWLRDERDAKLLKEEQKKNREEMRKNRKIENENRKKRISRKSQKRKPEKKRISRKSQKRKPAKKRS